MRHQKAVRNEPRPVTERRLAAARRALKKERDSHPLLAEQIAAEQPTPVERINAHEVENARHWQSIRDHRATVWRRARAIVAGLPPDQRDALSEAWNRSTIPADAAYFADFVQRHLRHTERR